MQSSHSSFIFLLPAGWQTDDCKYGPEKGVGVGDNINSCAFDGARCKVWSGPPNEQQNNDYGQEWNADDVLSCLFSWNGDVSFWLNGINMGVAFTELNSGVNWYPATSLAMDQRCCFNFGSKPFRYCDVIRERERERDGETETETERDRERDRQRQRQRDRQRDRDRDRDRQTERQRETETARGLASP